MIVTAASNFMTDVEVLAKKMDYIDAVVQWCMKNNIEIETAAALVKKDPVLRSKIEVEAENLNILKRSARLPI